MNYQNDENLCDCLEQVYCPVCGGESGLLGMLGNLEWLRCRYCGMEWHRSIER